MQFSMKVAFKRKKMHNRL